MKRYIIVIIFFLFYHYVSGQEIIDSSIVHLENVIFFENDEAILSEDDKTKILELVEFSKNYSDFKFWVDAHTDEVGSEAYNLELSKRRKESVVDFLILQNISNQSIESNFHGELKRIAYQEDEESRKLNRRVVLQLTTKKQFLYIKGAIIDEISKEGINATVRLSAPNYKKEAKTDSNGKFEILSPFNSSVSIEIVAKEYFIETKYLEISEKSKDNNLVIPLPKIEIGKSFRFENMFFEGDKSIMLRHSFPVLDHLKRFMSVNNEHCIEIAGHVNVPNATRVEVNSRYFQLSVARALEVHDALNERLIDSDRLLAKGYGNWNMVYPRASKEAHMEFNRRVEIIIADCDSTSTIPNHQIPNREEFAESGPLKKYYSGHSFTRDIENLPKKAQEDLRNQIKAMKKANLDPLKYTYRELILALPGIPQAK